MLSINETIKTLTETMVHLRSMEHNSYAAKSATYIDYALKELRYIESADAHLDEQIQPTKTENSTESESDDDDANVNPADDYSIEEAGGANPADDGNFGLRPAR